MDNFHQREPFQLQQLRPSFASSLAGTILLIYCAHAVLNYFDVAILSPQELLWNALIYTIPTPLLLDSARRQELRANDMLSQTHAAKSDTLRKILGLGGQGILQNLPTAGEAIGLGAVGRRLSTAAGLKNVTSDAPSGLGNWDNSCYQNSVLQALASLSSLRSWLAMSEPPQSDPSSTTNTALQEMIAKLRDANNNGRHIWTPAKLKNMSSWQQQDAQEYFSKVMDELDKEAKKAWLATQKQPGLEVILERDSKGEEQENEHERSQAEALRNPLEGLAAQRVACTQCGFSEGYSMIPFNCLTVPLGSHFVYDLEKCLDEYTKSEDIEGVECRSCTLLHAKQKLVKMASTGPSERETEGGHSTINQTLSLPPEVREQVMRRLQSIEKALDEDDFTDKIVKQDCQIGPKSFVNTIKTREAIIGRAPQTLVVHVNRSVFDEMTGMQRKNYAHVGYPMILDLRRWMLKAGETPASYKLSAVVTHYGRHENGHYICYRKHPRLPPSSEDNEPDADQGVEKERWWRLSDEDVSPVTEQDVLDQGGVFMLFYEKIDEPVQPSASAIEEPLQSTAVTEEAILTAASIPLPPEGEEWDMITVDQSSTSASSSTPPATPSLVTSSAQSEVSESDVECELERVNMSKETITAGKAVPAPILKTASPTSMRHKAGGMDAMARSMMSV